MVAFLSSPRSLLVVLEFCQLIFLLLRLELLKESRRAGVGSMEHTERKHVFFIF